MSVKTAEDEDDDEDNSGAGDNGESKLVFVLRSRHEPLVGTMGTPVLRTVGHRGE